MKTKINNYLFNKTAKTVTFTDYTTIRLDGMLLITNATDGVIIFNFADPAKGGTVTNNVLTLTYDTSAMDNDDKLLIYYDDAEIVPATSEDISNKDIMVALKSLILQVANPGYLDKTSNQIRAVVTGSVTSSTTITTVTNLTNLGSFPADHLQRQSNIASWELRVRNKIS